MPNLDGINSGDASAYRGRSVFGIDRTPLVFGQARPPCYSTESMGRQTAQGTRWESAIRTAFESTGATARRNAKTGRKHEADVTVDGDEMLPLVAWKAYLPAGTRRKALPLYILGADDFHRMYRELPPGRFGFHVQAKATQRLSVPTIYRGLRDWMRDHA